MSRPPTGSPSRVEQLEADVASLRAEIARMTEPRTPRPWRRRLSGRLAAIGLAVALIIPAGAVLASHQFNDVPTSHQFHNAIAAIADAGITTGCGGGNYCPDGLVTRGQMAAFMSRLGALQAGSAPKVNADRVDGRHANQFSRVAAFDAGGEILPDTGDIVVLGDPISISAPAAGFVSLTVSASVLNSGCTSFCDFLVYVSHDQSGTISSPAFQTIVDGFGTATTNAVLPVAAGTNTFTVVAFRGISDGELGVISASGTALYTPYGPTGGGVLGVDGPRIDRDSLDDLLAR